VIDYLKIHELPVSPAEILANDRLTFPLSNVATTGELLNRSQVAHFKELQFVVRGEKVNLKGSLHKHFEGGTNHRDFFLTDIKATIEKLAETFHFDPQHAVINFIEIGVNISLDSDPTKIIKTFVQHRNNPFEPLHINGKGFGRKCENQQITIKIYNKSLQYGLNEPLMRYEVKIKRMKFLERFGITGLTLADLTNPETYQPLKKMLLEVWQGILNYDPEINPESIKKSKDRELFISGRFPEFWQDMDKFQRTRKKKRFIELAGGKKISNQISELIEKKCNLLTTLQPTPETKKMQPFNHFAEAAKNEKMQPFNTTIKGYLVATCIVTGLPIKHPANGKKYLTQKDVEFYQKNEPEIYREKLESLLTKKWKIRFADEPLETWIEEICHKIRVKLSNVRRNPINNTRKSYRNIESKGLKLWATETLADPKKLELIAI
jgi:hypothetical protein